MSDMNSLFQNTSGLSGMLGDYSAIRSGSYKKLMKSYYGEVKSQSTGKSSSSKGNTVLDQVLEERRHPTVSKEVREANSKLSTSIASFRTSLGSLQSDKTYSDTENGETGRDKVKNALKSYVSAYNDSVKTAKKSTIMNMTSNVAGAMDATKENADALKEIGIALNNDGTLSFDEKAFQTIELSKVKDVFDGNAVLSYGSKVASRLNRISDYTASTSSSSDAKTNVATVSNSKNLKESIANLKGSDLYTKSKDSSGNEVLNRDGIKSELDKFIEFYNSTIQSAKSSGVSGVISNLTALKQKTAEHAASLAEVGITIGSDGKLSVNKDTFTKASDDKIQKNLVDYASSIETNASLLNYYSTTQNNSASGYSSNGTYSTNTSDIVSQLYGQV